MLCCVVVGLQKRTEKKKDTTELLCCARSRVKAVLWWLAELGQAVAAALYCRWQRMQRRSKFVSNSEWVRRCLNKSMKYMQEVIFEAMEHSFLSCLACLLNEQWRFIFLATRSRELQQQHPIMSYIVKLMLWWCVCDVILYGLRKTVKVMQLNSLKFLLCKM